MHTFAPNPLNMSTNSDPASSPSSVLTSTKMTQSFKISSGTDGAGVAGCAAADAPSGSPDGLKDSTALTTETLSIIFSLDPEDGSGAARAAEETTRLPEAVV